MFENLKKIQIEGGYFEPSSGLDLFDSNQCLSIIYGRNGSGKTSIAKAIRQLVGKDSKPQEGEVAVPYIVTSDAVIPEEKKPSVESTYFSTRHLLFRHKKHSLNL